MEWVQYLDVRAVPQYLAVALMLGLVAWLLRLDFNARANRAFALFLFFRAMAMLMGTFSNIAPDGVWDRLAGYYLIAVVPAVLYFVSVYPAPRGWLGRSPAGPWALLALASGLEVWYVLDRCAFACPAPGGLTAFGPLIAVPVHLVLGLAGLGFLVAYTRSPAGPRKQSFQLVGAVLVLNSLFDGLRGLGDVWSTGTLDPVAYGLVPNAWATVNLVGGPLTIAPSAGAVALVLAYWARNPEHAEARKRLSVAAALAVLSGMVVGVLFKLSSGLEVGLTILGLWRVAIPVGVTYAIVRHQLLDIDVRLKWTIRRGTVAGVFAGCYFLASESTEALISDQYGSLGGLAIAAMMSVALDPVRALAGKVAEFIMPGVDATPDHVRARKVEVYRVAFESVLEDGVITAKERAVLGRLRAKLQLPDDDAAKIEAAVAHAAARQAPG